MPYPLWVGHAGAGSDFERLYELGIEALVQVAVEELPVLAPRGMMYFRIPLVDGSDNPPNVLRLAVETVAGLIRLRIPTLVCCGMGLSRSPGVVAAALSLVLGEDPDEVLLRLAECHKVDVSPGFWSEVRVVRRSTTIEASE